MQCGSNLVTFYNKKNGVFTYTICQSLMGDGSLFMEMTRSENQMQLFAIFLMPIIVSYQNFKAHLDSI